MKTLTQTGIRTQIQTFGKHPKCIGVTGVHGRADIESVVSSRHREKAAIEGVNVVSINGVKPATVMQIADPSGTGRVLVHFNAGGSDVQAWAQVVHASTTAKSAKPRLAINDPVLLAFEDGSPDRAFVLGRL